jgi:hypothetical protein
LAFLPRVRGGIYFYNPFSVKRLHLFGLLQIGFVFSNRQAGETSDLLFAIAIVCCLLTIRCTPYDIRFTIHASAIGFVFSN